MYFLYSCLCLAAILRQAALAPADGFNFPREQRRDKKLEPIITPPVLPILEHLERDPSILLRNETTPRFRQERGHVKPRFGFGSGFSVAPSGNGGLTASVSSSASGAGASQSASQSFSFGFNQGFSGSHSASQSSSFSNGFNGGLSGSQASSQAASFGGNSGSSAISSAASLGSGGGHTGSQSASSAFGFNSPHSYNSPNSFNSQNVFTPPNDEVYFDDIDIRHRGLNQAGAFIFPGSSGRGVSASASRIRRPGPSNKRGNDDWLAILVSD